MTDETTDGAALTEATAAAYIAAAAFRIGPVGRVGVELEYGVRDPAARTQRPSIDRVRAATAPLLDPLPCGGAISIEPGGQIEISSAVGADLDACVTSTAYDLALTTRALADAGLVLEGTGLDTTRKPRLVTDQPRYVALAAYHDRSGGKGRQVMCNSASVQVCLDAGDDSDGVHGYRARWRLADSLGPVFLAAFANSPHVTRRGVRWVSYRQALRFATDAGRTRAPKLRFPTDTGRLRRATEPREAWADYALSARVVMIAGPEPWEVPVKLTMRDWLRGHGPREVTLEDLERHLGTLVPPVRPRGYLEFRMIDQQLGGGWVVPAAVVSALMDDPVAAAVALEATTAVRSRLRRHRDWVASAREGLGDPLLAAAALTCFEAAAEALARQGVSARIQASVALFIEEYVAQGRCPADRTSRDGDLLPVA